MDLPGRVHGFARQHQLWTPETAVIAAVSGGSDSVALLFILHALAREGLLRLAAVAHLHHHIRGLEADGDAEFVGGLAARLGLPLEFAHEDVPQAAARTGQSLEVAGRHARLAFFERLAAGPSAPVVALAHTRTDQAETVLLRLVRGAGPRGLAAMAPRAGHRVRPLLDTSRQVLRVWLEAIGEPWREDSSNADTGIARNQVRLRVMPQLRELNPSAEAALARAARIQASDGALLDQLAAVEVARLVRADEAGAVHLPLPEVRRLPSALARRVVRAALARVNACGTPSWRDTEAVLDATAAVDLGKTRLELFGDFAVLTNRSVARERAGAERPGIELTLTVPGSVRHPSGWWEIDAAGPTARTGLAPPATPGTHTGATRAVVDAAALGRHLTIRGWQPGDRVQPLGLAGRKKLQDVFVDRKVPRDERPQVPVVVDASGRIVWVAGHVVGEPFRVTPRSEAVVVLTLRR